MDCKMDLFEIFSGGKNIVTKMENVKTGLLNERNICTKKKTDGIAINFY